MLNRRQQIQLSRKKMIQYFVWRTYCMYIQSRIWIKIDMKMFAIYLRIISSDYLNCSYCSTTSNTKTEMNQWKSQKQDKLAL